MRIPAFCRWKFPQKSYYENVPCCPEVRGPPGGGGVPLGVWLLAWINETKLRRRLLHCNVYFLNGNGGWGGSGGVPPKAHHEAHFHLGCMDQTNKTELHVSFAEPEPTGSQAKPHAHNKTTSGGAFLTSRLVVRGNTTTERAAGVAGIMAAAVARGSRPSSARGAC